MCFSLMRNIQFCMLLLYTVAIAKNGFHLLLPGFFQSSGSFPTLQSACHTPHCSSATMKTNNDESKTADGIVTILPPKKSAPKFLPSPPPSLFLAQLWRSLHKCTIWKYFVFSLNFDLFRGHSKVVTFKHLKYWFIVVVLQQRPGR